MNTTTRRLLLASALFAAAGASADVHYLATAIPNLPGGTGSIAGGVNDLGWVVGQADNSSAQLVGFVYANGVTTELPLLAGGSNGYAHGVNNAGTIVGECQNANGTSRAVVWTLNAGVWTITDLGTFDSLDRGLGVAHRINNAGGITGYASTEGPASYHGFKFENGVMSDIGTLAYSGPLAYSKGLAINDVGHVAGYAYRTLGGPEHGLYFDGRGHDITPAGQFGLGNWNGLNSADTLAGYVSGPGYNGFTPAMYIQGGSIAALPMIPGMPEGYGYDINDASTIVGTNFLLAPFPEPNLFLAFVWSEGTTYDLNTVTDGLPAVITEAVDVSETGLIVGTTDTGAAPLAVLLTPVAPCPADFNGDGFLDFFDADAFVACFEGVECPPGKDADFNHDGFVDFFDADSFVEAFEAGC